MRLYSALQVGASRMHLGYAFFWGVTSFCAQSSCDTQQAQQHLCFVYFLFFIWNIPKHINYIMK